MKLSVTYRAFNSGGSGGQHGNRSLTAIEATAVLPDGEVISATSKTHKSQKSNKKSSLAVLRVRVRAYLLGLQEKPERVLETVRTYHIPNNRVTDHRSQLQTPWKSIDKDFARQIAARADAMRLGKLYSRGSS